MKLKEVYVKLEKPAEIFTVIENALMDNRGTQIFVDMSLYQKLRYHGHGYNVFSHNYAMMDSGSHYYRDDDYSPVEWLTLHVSHSGSEEIAKASFVTNCKDYKQVVQYMSENIENYIHYCARFDVLLVIHAE